MSDRPLDPAVAALLEENRLLLAELRPALPGEALMERLRAISAIRPARAEAQETLSLLVPGTLARPSLPSGLEDRLRQIPRLRPRKAAAPVRPPSRIPAFLLDWRVSVAVAYAAAAVVVAFLGVDPLTSARRAAFDLASTGQQAIEEARGEAEKRVRSAAMATFPGAFSRQLDYRLYRGVQVSKAKAAAWGSLVIDRLFGHTDEQPARAGQRELPASPRTGLPEPDGPEFRS